MCSPPLVPGYALRRPQALGWNGRRLTARCTGLSTATLQAAVVRTGPGPALPHRPQEDVVEKFRSSEVSGGAARGARTASTLVQVVAPSAAAPGRRTLVMRSAAGTTPSLNQGTGREVEVVAGGAQGHHARAVGGRYLHRLFHGRGVRAVRGLPAPGAQGRDAELSPGPCPRHRSAR